MYKKSLHLTQITGDKKPGWIYGTVKIQKEHSLLRPNISQATTFIYELTKH